MSARPSLRERLSDPSIVVALGVHDGLTARLAERAGVEAFYHGGYAAAAHHHGLPDIGMVGLEEMVESVRRVTLVSTRPVIVDCDTGYGAIAGVKRTVQEMERAGAGAIQIEDQVFPKRCGHFSGKEVVSTDEMVSKVHAAVDSRADENLLIIARTDARATEGLTGAIDRAAAYREAGADVLFIEAPTTVEELAEVGRHFDCPLVANMVEGGVTPIIDTDELAGLGFTVVLYANAALRAAQHNVQVVLDHLRRTGTTTGITERMASWQERQDAVGKPHFDELEERYKS